MIETVYFYHTVSRANPQVLNHGYVCLAEGFKKIGIRCFGNSNLYSSDNCLITYEKDLEPLDVDIIFFCDALYVHEEEASKIIKNFAKQKRRAAIVFIDAADGVRTPGFNAVPFCDIVLKCHYNTKYHYPDKFIPWQFGFNSRILNAVKPLEYSERDNSILVNFRIKHQLRDTVNDAIKPIVEQNFKWDTTADPYSMEGMSDEDKFLFKQAGGRHNPLYYQRLSRSKLCACYGGVFAIPYGNHDKYSAKIARKINNLIPIFEYDRVRQWDSWRLWEAWVAGCTVLHIDFNKYGCKLPVMPQNGTHYIGIDIEDLPSLQELIKNENRLEEIAANGREFAINNYSPEKTAERLLEIVANENFNHS